MGQSTNAILFYGYCWDDEDVRYPWQIGSDEREDDEEWETRFAKAAGWVKPASEYPSRRAKDGYYSTPTDYTAEEQAIIEEHRAAWTKKREIAETSPCECDTHCSGDYPMPLVAVKASKHLAYRGDPVALDAFNIDPAWNDQLIEFCDKLGIKIDGLRVGWWLVSDWH